MRKRTFSQELAAHWGSLRALNLVEFLPFSKHEPRRYQRRILRRIAASALVNPKLVNAEFQAVAPAAMAPVLTSDNVAGSGVVVEPTEQLPVLTVLVSRVTAPVRPIALPQSIVAPVFSVTLASAITLP